MASKTTHAQAVTKRDGIVDRITQRYVDGAALAVEMAQDIASLDSLYVQVPSLGSFVKAACAASHLSVGDVDRYKRAGYVVGVVGAGTVPKGTVPRALAAFYRIIAKATDAEATALANESLGKAFAEAVTKAKGGPVTEKIALQVAAKYAGGTRGKKAKAKADGTNESPKSDADEVTLDAAIVAATVDLDRKVGSLVSEGADALTVLVIVRDIATLCETHGTAAVFAAAAAAIKATKAEARKAAAAAK